ncbi:MAG TPA: hypothetical protein VK866_02175 [Acidimicrobiales bacterium]|nr:hypothetical protein [Acidimicrobiales bacterium]
MTSVIEHAPGHAEQLLLRTARAFQVFLPAGELVADVHLLAVNSRVAAAHLGDRGDSYAIVADTLGELGPALRRFVDDGDEVFSELVARFAAVARTEHRIESHRRVLGRLDDHGRRPGATLDPGSAASWPARAADPGPARPGWQAGVAERERMLIEVAAIAVLMDRLSSLIVRIRQFGAREFFMVALQARIEAAHLSGVADLGGVSADMSTLARAVAAAVAAATEDAEGLEGAIAALVAPVRGELGADRPIAAVA